MSVESSACPTCGKPLSPNDALMGLCPDCLMRAGFATATCNPGSEGAKAFEPPTPQELGARFPQLDILELLGRGGMGAVYKARQKPLDRLAALKILPPGVSGDPTFAERFAREAKALAKLHHPNIVTLYEFGEAEGGQFYFLMEFVDGLNLRQLLNAGQLAPKEALAIVPQICEALQFAHDRGIVHRDIKPENILLNKDGQVKIADFGVAKIVAGASPEAPAAGAANMEAAHTEAGQIVGTPQYMAPEQIAHPGEVDNRADIYALGVVFYQMLTGELPAQHVQPPSRKVQIDVRLDEIVLKALEKEPSRRYQQVSVMKTQVETLAGTPAQPSGAPPVERSLMDFTGILKFRSVAALRFAQAASAGFLGFLGFIPGWERLFGLFGLFGLIGSAYEIEAFAKTRPDQIKKGLYQLKPALSDRPYHPGAAWIIMAGFAVVMTLMGWAILHFKQRALDLSEMQNAVLQRQVMHGEQLVEQQLRALNIAWDNYHIELVPNSSRSIWHFTGLREMKGINGKNVWTPIEGSLNIALLENNAWQVSGDGGLGHVHFMVNAPAQTAEASSGFGPVIERELSANETLENTFLDLDTGAVLSAPKQMSETLRGNGGSPSVSAIREWMRANGADAVARTGNPSQPANLSQVDGFGPLIAEKQSRSSGFTFNRATAEQVTDWLESSEKAFLGNDADMLWGYDPKGVYAFKTREGGAGLLEIIEADPHRVKLHYKLVRSRLGQ